MVTRHSVKELLAKNSVTRQMKYIVGSIASHIVHRLRDERDTGKIFYHE